MASSGNPPSIQLPGDTFLSPIDVLPTQNEPHAELINRLKGQMLHVPNMLSLFPSWPSGRRNKNYKRLKASLDRISEVVFPDEAMRMKASKSDFALFSSIWFPEADWDGLYTCALYIFWIFHCDDAMDDKNGSVSEDFAASCRYRQQVIEYTRYCLGLDDPVSPQTSSISSSGWTPPCPSLPNSVFKQFGQRIQLTSSKAFREMFHRDIQLYLEHCEIEQRERMTGQIPPDMDNYMRVRHYTSGFRTCGYLAQLATGIRLPVRIMTSPQMQTLWDEITIIMSIENDILSVRKELAGGCIHNAVPVMFQQGQRALDGVIRELVARLENSRDRFDQTARKVYMMMTTMSGSDDDDDLVHREEILRYINVLQTNATATIEFCTFAPRYQNEKYLNVDGTMDIVL
ncbi:isoprenoid synthase domain-containing protein [Podospora didyma]|uniref:Terpene synthase n=1 Tax=Podospora didyma TaxID=330526 RepID=A0AAE0P4Z0_9PEZI|nr:isoprenoid synthase domain-containing protein [Podospora didyma]